MKNRNIQQAYLLFRNINPFMKNLIFSSLLLIFGLVYGQAQNTVSSLDIDQKVQQAISKGTRTMSGEPGPAYFQNRSDYVIQAELHPEERKLSGEVKISYQNNSPDVLDKLVLRLYQDMYKRGFDSDDQIAEEDRTDGVEISDLILDGKELKLEGDDSPVSRKGTNMFIELEEGMKPGSKINLSMKWAFQIPEKTHVRMGKYATYSYFIAYWYPQIAVYDDIEGWDELDYTGTQEFYNDFGDFDVTITVPDSFLVWATGVLEKPEDLLTPTYYKRYQAAKESDEVIKIVAKEDYESGEPIVKPSPDHRNSWHFKASFVPDFAFAAADFYYWDANSVVVDGKRVLVDACYNPNAKDFYEVAGFAREIIDHMSTVNPGVPYPYPKMTIYNGERVGGGMEYPMMVNDASTFSRSFTFNLTHHEIAHTWFPFYMGINERKYAWMDEGWASFFPEDLGVEKGFSSRPNRSNVSGYVAFAGARNAKPLMTSSYDLQGMVYGTNSYSHPATAYFLLRDLLGHETFYKCLHGYMDRWNGKHPGPYDFFFSFNDIAEQDLSWFWKPWFFETGVPDLAIKPVKIKGKKANLMIENKGTIPVPIHLTVTLKDGTKEEIHETAAVWKDGAKTWEFNRKFSKPVKTIKLGASYIPDVNSKDNSYK